MSIARTPGAFALVLFAAPILFVGTIANACGGDNDPASGGGPFGETPIAQLSGVTPTEGTGVLDPERPGFVVRVDDPQQGTAAPQARVDRLYIRVFLGIIDQEIEVPPVGLDRQDVGIRIAIGEEHGGEPDVRARIDD